MAGDHLAGRAILAASAETGISARRLPALLDVAQVDLAPRLDEYRLKYERVLDDGQTDVFLAESDHWQVVGDRLGFERDEVEALEQAHEEHLRHVGEATSRREEFEYALDIRTAVVIDTDSTPKAGGWTDAVTGPSVQGGF